MPCMMSSYHLKVSDFVTQVSNELDFFCLCKNGNLYYYSVKCNNIIPKILILFRKGGILMSNRGENYVYDSKRGRCEVGNI